MSISLIHPGIYRITLPLKMKKPGPVNVYLFKGKDNITILDTGTYLSSRYLETSLAKIGVRFSRIDRIILTHGHVDHYGAAHVIRKKGPKHLTVCAHPADIGSIETGSEAPMRSYRNFLKYAGTPLIMQTGVVLMFFWLRRLSRTCGVDHPLKNGEQIMLGDYEGRIIETPGHTRGSICVYLEKENILFSGDHVLDHITPNALPMLERHSPLPVRVSQAEYYQSLEIVENLSPSIIHTAHGKPVRDFTATHALYKSCFAKRQLEILETVRNNPGKTLYHMALAHFPAIKGPRFLLDLFLAISEIYTHVQVLEKEGRVVTSIKQKTLQVEYVK